MDLLSLTDNQFHVVLSAFPTPYILPCRADKLSARALEKKGWGTVESGASGEVIFRLNQDAENQVVFESESWIERWTEPRAIEAQLAKLKPSEVA